MFITALNRLRKAMSGTHPIQSGPEALEFPQTQRSEQTCPGSSSSLWTTLAASLNLGSPEPCGGGPTRPRGRTGMSSACFLPGNGAELASRLQALGAAFADSSSYIFPAPGAGLGGDVARGGVCLLELHGVRATGRHNGATEPRYRSGGDGDSDACRAQGVGGHGDGGAASWWRWCAARAAALLLLQLHPCTDGDLMIVLMAC